MAMLGIGVGILVVLMAFFCFKGVLLTFGWRFGYRPGLDDNQAHLAALKISRAYIQWAKKGGGISPSATKTDIENNLVSNYILCRRAIEQYVWYLQTPTVGDGSPPPAIEALDGDWQKIRAETPAYEPTQSPA